MWPDVIPPKTSPLAVGKLDTTICDRLNFSLASTRQFATQEVVDSTRATLRKFEREAHCKPSESHGVRAARSVVQSLDPFEAGFASVSASKWRQEWEKRVLERTSLRFGGAKASRSSRDSRTDALTGLNDPESLPQPQSHERLTSASSSPRPSFPTSPSTASIAIAPIAPLPPPRDPPASRTISTASLLTSPLSSAPSPPPQAEEGSFCSDTWVDIVWTPELIARHSSEARDSSEAVRLCSMTVSKGVASDHFDLPEQVVEQLRRGLSDRSQVVHLAAAISLLCTGNGDDKIINYLIAHLDSATPRQRWVIARCLASALIAKPSVILEVFSHVAAAGAHNDEAATLLVRLSATSKMVRSLVGEQLAACDWRHRRAALWILPKLHGGLGRDISDKMLSLAADDWHSTVRMEAVSGLQAAGLHAAVLLQLPLRLAHHSEAVRVEALRFIGSQRTFDARAEAAVMRCLADPIIGVRIEAVQSLSRLSLLPSSIAQAIVVMIVNEFDTSLRVVAISVALKLRPRPDSVKETIFSLVRTSSEPSIFEAACDALIEEIGSDQSLVDAILNRTEDEFEEMRVIARQRLVRLLGPDGATRDMNAAVMAAVVSQLDTLSTRDAIIARLQQS